MIPSGKEINFKVPDDHLPMKWENLLLKDEINIVMKGWKSVRKILHNLDINLYEKNPTLPYKAEDRIYNKNIYFKVKEESPENIAPLAPPPLPNRQQIRALSKETFF